MSGVVLVTALWLRGWATDFEKGMLDD
jgi:hypothetical protein